MVFVIFIPRPTQSSTSKVQSAQLPGPSNVTIQASAQIQGQLSVQGGYPPEKPSSVQGTPSIQKLPTRGPTICQLPYGHPGSVRDGFQSRKPFQIKFDVPKSPFPAQTAARSQSVLPIQGVVPAGNPLTLTPIRPRVKVREENQGWKFPVKNNLRPISRSENNLGTSYNQFKSVINSSALPNKTSSQNKRSLINPSIEPPIPMKRSRKEEKEPRFVCRIDTCNYSGCIELPVFKSLDEHRSHMRNIHPERFVCKRCPFSSKLKGSVINHENAHSQNDRIFRVYKKGVSCYFCNVTFAGEYIGNCNSRLKKHNEQFH